MRIIDRLLWAMATDIGRSLYMSIENEPSSWESSDGYRLENSNSKVSIWIANRGYGLKVSVGATFPELGSEVTPSAADRRLIWHAIKRLNIPSTEAFRAGKEASREVSGNRA